MIGFKMAARRPFWWLRWRRFGSKFFFFQIVSISCIEVVYDLKCWISSKIMFMKFKMAAGRPFCSSVVFRLIRSQVHISSWITLILSIRGYDLKTLNEFENHRAQIQNGRPAAILFFSVDTRSSPHFFTNQPHIWYMGISIPNAERVRKPPWSDSKWPPSGHFVFFSWYAFNSAFLYESTSYLAYGYINTKR